MSDTTEKLPCEFVVGSAHFGRGVSVAAAQGAVDRLYERMRLMECRLGELCYSCKLGIGQYEAVRWISTAPDAASGGTKVAVHDDCDKATVRTFLPARK